MSQQIIADANADIAKADAAPRGAAGDHHQIGLCVLNRHHQHLAWVTHRQNHIDIKTEFTDALGFLLELRVHLLLAFLEGLFGMAAGIERFLNHGDQNHLWLKMTEQSDAFFQRRPGTFGTIMADQYFHFQSFMAATAVSQSVGLNGSLVTKHTDTIGGSGRKTASPTYKGVVSDSETKCRFRTATLVSMRTFYLNIDNRPAAKGQLQKQRGIPIEP